MTGAYFCYPISEGIVKATAQFAQAAKEHGVGIVVNMSQVIAREDARSNASLQHWLAERVFDWSGVPVTHIRPTFFLEWLFYMAPMIQAGTVYAPYGSGKTALISGEDQGRVIAAILQDQNPTSARSIRFLARPSTRLLRWLRSSARHWDEPSPTSRCRSR